MSALFASLLPYLLMAGAALVAFLGYGAHQKSAGRKEQAAKQAAADKAARDIGDQVENDIGALPKGAAREELRKWGK